jgi:hypothetical protein
VSIREIGEKQFVGRREFLAPHGIQNIKNERLAWHLLSLLRMCRQCLRATIAAAGEAEAGS